MVLLANPIFRKRRYKLDITVYGDLSNSLGFIKEKENKKEGKLFEELRNMKVSIEKKKI